MAQNWEYQSVLLHWRKDSKQYESGDTGSKIVGFGNVMNAWGGSGWELVSVVAEYLDGTQYGWSSASVTLMRAVFKRPKS